MLEASNIRAPLLVVVVLSTISMDLPPDLWIADTNCTAIQNIGDHGKHVMFLCQPKNKNGIVTLHNYAHFLQIRFRGHFTPEQGE